MRRIIIPGSGWDTESVISGFIKVREHGLVNQTMEIINAYDFDDTAPFTNIFAGGSPAAYGFAVIGFAGSYKQIEESWNEWMWKFTQLLSRLDAIEAHVNLSCLLGDYDWKLEPRLRFEDRYSREPMRGQVWGITDAPEPDFSTDPTWLMYCCSSRTYSLNEKTGDWLNEAGWRRLVERWSVGNRGGEGGSSGGAGIS